MTRFGIQEPQLETPIPGPRSQAAVTRLAKTECPAITARRARRTERGGASQDPIVWASARGANVRDVDDNVYVDLTGAFAVCAVGHAHPDVVAAGQQQLDTLPHAMGDLYPSEIKIRLAEKLAARTPGDLQMSIFGQSGSEAVEAALKTAVMATGKSRVVAFSGAYHGMGYGALSVTGYRGEFRRPVKGQTVRFGVHMPYAHCYRCPLGLEHPSCRLACLGALRAQLDDPGGGFDDVGAVLVEPIQGRGGVIVPPDDWLRELVSICRERELLVIFDEIFTGFGRTGEWFACEHVGVVPDLMCVGKAMGGGFPISAAIGTPAVMGAWGLTRGEALHTSTFLGNPVGCAMALATLEVIERDGLVREARRVGARLTDAFEILARDHLVIGDVRGRGAMIGVELVKDRVEKTPATTLALGLVRRLLERGYLVLPSGVRGNVLSFAPPLVITDAQLDGFLTVFEEVLASCSAN